MILIIGLGNPGKKYQNTRHNVGYWVIDQLSKEKPRGLVFAKTNTLMNESGKVVKKLVASYRLPITSLLVIHDDIDLPLGEFKIQKGRGSAGHKGVQSIIDELGTKDFWRVRIGICPKRLASPDPAQRDKPQNIEKFVLQNFTKEEERIIKKAVGEIVGKIINR